ncbi:MAG: DEAD/DEAH box helicase [Lewinella sp.]|uniref:DEAD/DEAH box helicase n=1 Tax=Lewinella sp. TaxID=2004506 RepID=UPI003D6A3C6F
MTFNSLGIIDPILRALEVKGYTKPTPIQEQAIPILLEGKDLLGCAQTGTGKTAAFAIPIIQQLCEAQLDGPYVIKTLVVAPTRELAIQINDSFRDYAKFTDLRTTVIFGGVKQGKQVEILQKGVDILVATPGRLLDLMNQGYISLRDVEFVVLDEADHMLDMGFIHDIKKIVAKLPEKRQSLFFSATMPPAILDLSSKILGRPERVTIKPQQATAEKVEQAVYFVAKKQKRKLLLHLIQEEKMDSVLVFSRTKHGANRIVKDLIKDGIGAAAIHGNKSQTARQKALKEFRQGKVQVLVATDIAARGIDVDELAFVINFDLPNVAETYVHRIGRTGRAQASGIAISFCDQEERAYLRDIQRLIKQDVPVVTDHPYVDDGTQEVSPPSSNNQRSRGNGGSNHRRRGQGNGYSGGDRSGGSRSGGGNRRRSSSSRQHS